MVEPIWYPGLDDDEPQPPRSREATDRIVMYWAGGIAVLGLILAAIGIVAAA